MLFSQILEKQNEGIPCNSDANCQLITGITDKYKNIFFCKVGWILYFKIFFYL